MSWPPSEQEWAEILKDLLADQHVAVRAAIDKAQQDYLRDASRYKLWKAIAKQADSMFMQSFREKVQELHAYPLDPESEWLLRLVAELGCVSARAKARAEVYLPRNRKQRLYAGILRAWTDSDERRRLGTSEEGPAQRFLCAIVQHLGFLLSQRGAKDVISREHDRRETLNVREEQLSGTGAFQSDLIHKKGDEPAS